MKTKERYVEVAINQGDQILFLCRIEALDRKTCLLQCSKGTFSRRKRNFPFSARAAGKQCNAAC